MNFWNYPEELIIRTYEIDSMPFSSSCSLRTQLRGYISLANEVKDVKQLGKALTDTAGDQNRCRYAQPDSRPFLHNHPQNLREVEPVAQALRSGLHRQKLYYVPSQ